MNTGSLIQPHAAMTNRVQENSSIDSRDSLDREADTDRYIEYREEETR